MRKKLTMLLMSLLCCVGVVKAQYYVIESVGDNITDLSTLTENSYVALYNVGKSKYIYEGGDHKLYMGTAAEVGAGHEYIWQVHKEGEKFLFTSASGRYFSTPLDGSDVFTVSSGNSAKDKFSITAHQQDNTKWKVQSTNNSKFWDAQDNRFVGWSGTGTNSQYEIRPVTVSVAEENEFNKLITTNENAIKWYTIKNVRQNKYVNYSGDSFTMLQQETVASAAALFYFTGRATAENATVGIHNLLAGDKLCSEYNSWTATGREWLIKKQSTGLSIAHTNNTNNAWNDADGAGQKLGYWGDNDPGSAWQFEPVTDFSAYLTAAKNAAILEMEKLSEVSAIYADVAQQFKTEVEGVTENSAQGLLAVNNILENFRKSIDGKSMKFRVDGRGSRFLGYSKTNDRIETQILGFDDAYWTLKYVGNGYFNLYNPVHKVWLGGPDSKYNEIEKQVDKEDENGEIVTDENGNPVKETVKEKVYYTPGLDNENEADASLYKFEVTTGGNTVLLVAGNGNIAHAAGDNHVMHYSSTTDQASWWAITDVCTFPITYDEYKEFLTEKSAMMSQLTGYAKQLQDDYGLVQSGEKISIVVNHPGTLGTGDCQPSSNLLDGNNGTYVHSSYDTTMEGEEGNKTMAEGHRDQVPNHYIEVELSEATQNIFCYFSKRNSSNRPAVIKVLAGNSADALTEVATLNMAESTDDNVQAFFSGAIDLGATYTHLRFVVTKTNTGSKFFTLSEFYVLPVNTTTEGIAALAGASIVDTDLEERLAAAEKSLKTLLLPETLAEVERALDANAENHVPQKPALGQYTTATYKELEAAYEACTTIGQLDDLLVAFDKFKKSKNLPVFTIDGAGKDYAIGKSIYDDGVDAPNFKDTDKLDKTMWWALDQTETQVGVIESVGIYNVGTGNGFWGASSIKVTETSENDATDGIFLFYVQGVGKDNTMHAQETDQVIVNYNATEKTSGSAWKFTYIGNSYDLADVAKIGDTPYSSLEVALEAAQANQTITLIHDVQLDEYLTIDKSITLDLGEYDIQCGMKDGEDRTALYVNGEDIEVTINGTIGKVTGCQALSVNNGLVKINGGYFHGTNDNGEAVYVMDNGKVEIYGGTFSGRDFVLNQLDSSRETSSITVYGGTFVGFNPANNVAEGDGTNFVAEGYGVVENEGTYVVKRVIHIVDGMPCKLPTEAETIYEVSYTRTFAEANTWYALYLPFEVPADYLEDYDIAEFTSMNVSDDNRTYMTVTMVEDKLEANTPYLIRAQKDGAELSITLNDVSVQAMNTPKEFTFGSETVTINGVYTETVASTIPNAYALSSGVFKQAAEETQVLKPFRFYLMLDGFSQSRIITISVEGEDGATSIDSELMSPVSGVIYDLQGRRVENPTKGLYIVNGKKVMIK